MAVQKQIYLIYTMAFLDMFAVSLVIPMLMPHVRSLGGSAVINGLLGSLYGALQLFSSPYVGSWSDLRGRKQVLGRCIAFAAVSYAILGSTGNIYVIFVSRAIAGCFKHTQTLLRTILSDIVQGSERSKSMGYFNAFGSFGFIIGPTVGGHMAEINNGFSWICLAATSLFVMNWVLLYTVLDDSVIQIKRSRRDSHFTGIVSNMRSVCWADCWDIMLVRFLTSLSILVYRTNLSLVLDQLYGASPKTIGYLTSFQGIVGTTAGFFTETFNKWYHEDYVLQLVHGAILQTLALYGLTQAPSLYFVALCLIPMSISNSVLRVACTEVTIMVSSPKTLGCMIGLGQSTASFARMICPMIAGIAQDMSLHGPALCGSLSAGVGSLVSLYMKAKLKR